MHKFKLKIACMSSRLYPSFGSVLHGMLIEHLPDDWKEILHGESVRPISQWIEFVNNENSLWHVSVTDDGLGDLLNGIFSEDTTWECKHLKAPIHLELTEHTTATLFEYMEPFFTTEEPYDGVNLLFRTATTHKTQGKYAIFPSVSLIANSLNKRLCSVSPDFALADPEAFDQVVAHTEIRRYQLNSARYALEGAGVIGYTGSVELRFSGPDALKRLAGVLFGFAEWSGVGIKTALGMGGCKAILLRKKPKLL